MKRNIILIAYGSGGHREQMRRIVEDLKKAKPDRHFVSVCDSNVKTPLTENYFRNLEIKKEKSLIFKLPIAYFKAFFQIVKLRLEGNEINAAICTGPGIGLVYLPLLRLFKCHTIFLESWSRFDTKSFTGKFLYPIVDIFIVQNKGGLIQYTKAIYLGGRL